MQSILYFTIGMDMMTGERAIMLAVTVIDSHLGMRFDSNILTIKYTAYTERIKIVIFDDSRQMNPMFMIIRMNSMAVSSLRCFQSRRIMLSVSRITANMA